MDRWIKSKLLVIITVIIISILSVLGGIGLGNQVKPIWSSWGNLFGGFEVERTDGGYYTILDENRKVIHRTVHCLYQGDEYITAKNLRYRINKIEGDFAYTKLVGREPEAKLTAFSGQGVTSARIFPDRKEGQRNAIAIYHTHSDESYVPTDGTDSIYARGGIFCDRQLKSDPLDPKK